MKVQIILCLNYFEFICNLLQSLKSFVLTQLFQVSCKVLYNVSPRREQLFLTIYVILLQDQTQANNHVSLLRVQLKQIITGWLPKVLAASRVDMVSPRWYEFWKKKMIRCYTACLKNTMVHVEMRQFDN